MSSPEASPAGWYPDPAGTGLQRYFDGSEWTAHKTAPPSPTRMSNEDRVDKFDAFLSTELHRSPTMRVESRTPYQAVIVTGSTPNHVVHALITIFTCGFWALIWLLVSSTQKERRSLMAIDPYGNITWA